MHHLTEMVVMMVLIGIIILILAITLIIMGSMIVGEIYHLYFSITISPFAIFLTLNPKWFNQSVRNPVLQSQIAN